MKITAKSIWQFVLESCAICVLISLFFFLFAQIIMSAQGASELGISFSQYALFILFSFLLHTANLIFRTPISHILQLLIHYIGCMFIFFLLFIVAGKKISISGASQVFVLIFAFTLCYALVYGITRLVRYLLRRGKKAPTAKPEEPVYHSRFQ